MTFDLNSVYGNRIELLINILFFLISCAKKQGIIINNNLFTKKAVLIYFYSPHLLLHLLF